MAAGAFHNDDGGAAIVTYFGVASIPCPTSPDRANGVGEEFAGVAVWAMCAPNCAPASGVSDMGPWLVGAKLK